MVRSRWLVSGRNGRRTVRVLAIAGTAVLLSGVTAGAAAAQSPGAAAAPGGHGAAAGHAAGSRVRLGRAEPAGFWYGTDSWPITIGGTPPYQEPAIGGSYGGYIGMAGNWAWWLGCHGKIAWSPANSQQANTNFTEYHVGIGTGVYWFMGGPGVDPDYNGTTSEAFAFGEKQAGKTLYELGHMHISLTYPVIFEDVELPGIAPAPDNGWNSVYTSPCSGKVKQGYVPLAVDRADFNGYADYITSHSSYKVGVYSAPASGPRSSAPEVTRSSPTPTNGPTPATPAACRTRPTAGACGHVDLRAVLRRAAPVQPVRAHVAVVRRRRGAQRVRRLRPDRREQDALDPGPPCCPAG